MNVHLDSCSHRIKCRWLSLVTGLVAGALLQAKPGANDPSFKPEGGGNGSVLTILVQKDSKILIGGRFTEVNGEPHYGLARLFSDGSTDRQFWPLFENTPDFSPVVTAILPQRDKILVCGGFTKINWVPRRGIARLNQNGSLDTSFADFPWQGVRAAVVQADDKIVIARGDEIRRLNPDGSVDSTFTAPSIYLGPTPALALQDDGMILVGGRFGPIQGVYRQHLARLNADGSLDKAFSPAFPITGLGDVSVSSILVQPEGKILVGKSLVSGPTHPYQENSVDRVNADGSYDNTFKIGIVFSVESMALQDDGRILVGSHYLARLNPNGALDRTFPSSSFASIYSIKQQEDGRILVGGAFGSINGGSGAGIARLFGGTVPELFRPSRQSGSFSLSLKTVTGKQYVLEHRDSLADGAWIPLFRVTGTGMEQTLTDPVGSILQRFYRVREE